MNYEADTRSPDASYLAGIGQAGADVLYIVMGVRASEPPPELPPDEHMVLAGYRQLDARGRAGVLGLITGITESERSSAATLQ